MAANTFDPENVNLLTADPAQVICALNASGNEYDGKLGARISSIFVIWIISTLVTVFPVAAKRVKRLKVSQSAAASRDRTNAIELLDPSPRIPVCTVLRCGCHCCNCLHPSS